MCPSFLSYYEFSLHQHKISDEIEFWSNLTSHFGITCPCAVKKNDVSSFSQSPLIGSLSNLQVTRTGINARTSSNLNRIGLFTFELFATERGFFSHRLKMEKMMSPLFSSPVVRCPYSLNIFSSEITWPVKVKIPLEPPWDRGTKVFPKGTGHMTKMAAMPIYG